MELYPAQNVDIQHNQSSGGVVTFEAAGDTRGIRIWRNEIWNEGFLTTHQANNMTVVNNTIWNMTTAMTFFSSGFGDSSTDGFIFTNNIVVASGAFFYIQKEWASTATISHNLYYSMASPQYFGCTIVCYTTFDSWRTGTGKEAASVSADPNLVSPTTNFTPGLGSPAIDRGQVVSGITDGSQGVRPDIGAREYGA